MPKKLFTVAAVLLCAVLSACAMHPVLSGPREVKIRQQWTGDYPVAALDRLPAGQAQNRVGYFGDQTSFWNAWHAFRPGEPMPTVDFSKNLVVYIRTGDADTRISIASVILDSGVVEVVATETRSAVPIGDRAAMAMAVIRRAGIEQLRTGPDKTLEVVP